MCFSGGKGPLGAMTIMTAKWHGRGLIFQQQREAGGKTALLIPLTGMSAQLQVHCSLLLLETDMKEGFCKSTQQSVQQSLTLVGLDSHK